jgi:haloalkane dehalogenase
VSAPLPTAGGLAYRSAGPPDGPPVLLVHGWPESSWMWRTSVAALGDAGFRAIAPDLPGYGDSPSQRPATWSTHVAALEVFRRALGLESAALVVHDWGGLIGLRWACDQVGVASALVISNTGFFPDGRWHGFAQAMRTPGEGEKAIDGFTREAFGALFKQISPGMTDEDVDEYFRPFATADGRAAQLELYRSGEFSELAPYEGRLAALGVPTLLLWGENDPFAPIAGAHRFQREIPHAELEVVEGVGHFVTDDAPEDYSERLVTFLRRVTRTGVA